MDSLLANAHEIGYTTLRLNTASFMKEAQALYHTLGFKATEAYYEVPDAFRPYELFMERTL